MNINHILFIYDETIMKTEFDSLKDALVFINPKESSDELFMFLGQLVGMVSFTKSLTQSVPSSLKLENMKFTIMQKSHFLLFLGFRGLDQPESYLKKKLQMFIDIFTFYNGSFERLLQLCRSREHFISQLDLLCSSYIMFNQCYLNTITSIFYPVPHISFNKVTSIIFLKAAQLLEACGRENSIQCGCLLSEGRMVYSQIPDKLAHHLLLLNQQYYSAPVFHPGFDCPIGVSIIRTYVLLEQYNQIVSSSSSYKNKTRMKMGSLVDLKDNFKNDNFLPNNSKHELLSQIPTFTFNNETDSFNTSADFYSSGDNISSGAVNQCESRNSSKDQPSNLVQDGTIELHLYVQNHSNTTLLLFMKPQAIYKKEEIRKLWELSLPYIGDIEAQVKSLISSQEHHNAREKSESHLSYQKMGLCNNNLKKMDNEEDQLIDTINTIHQQFKSTPGTTDIFLRNHLFTICGKQTEAEELFYQPNIKQRSTGELQLGTDMTWSFDLYSSNDRQNLKKAFKN